MEFPDRPIGRENPNSLSLEAAPPAHLNSGSGTGPKRALKANTLIPSRAARKTHRPCAFLRAQAWSRGSQPQAYTNTSPSPPHGESQQPVP